MTNSIVLAAVISAITIISLTACNSETSNENQISKSNEQQMQNNPINQGRKAYKDPVTGDFTAPPPGQNRPASNANTSAIITGTPLVEKPSPVSGGGVLLDLQGRFMQEVRVSKDANGNLHTNCSPVGQEHKSHEK